jgi:hypothetical protein
MNPGTWAQTKSSAQIDLMRRSAHFFPRTRRNLSLRSLADGPTSQRHFPLGPIRQRRTGAPRVSRNYRARCSPVDSEFVGLPHTSMF